MKTDHCFPKRERKLCRVWRLSLACLVVLVLQGCGRGAKPDGSAAKRDAAAPAAAAKEAEGISGPKQVAEASPEVNRAAEPGPELGSQLYARHCASCHGERGDGKGLAATFLFPKPRDLRSGRFRLVSTDNNVPTREDLQAVLLRGMPGSSMPPWAHLPQQERDALVDEVLRIRRDGARESYVQTLKDEEGMTEEEIAAVDVQEEIQAYVEEVTTAGASRQVPDIQSPNADAIARGKEVYAKFACIQCHGETGKGDGAQEMFDDEQLPTRPRDFTLGIFKGNHDPASLYRRVAYGMPGSPMPSSVTMTPEQMVDLVHYVLSLSTEEQRQAAIPKREKVVARRVGSIPQSEQDSAWSQVEPMQLRITPLWWRNDANADLTVQTVHDGKTIAVRLSWKDATADHRALRSESFEDAVAMQLYGGPAEPFLGMGDRSSPVDMWFWDSDRQQGPAEVEAEYPNAVVDVYPFSETAAARAGLDRPGARIADQPDVSLPARASGNQIVPTEGTSGGSSLQVGGPRTVTFRPPQSQLVTAKGTWEEGRWIVIMTRSLSVPSQTDGVGLVPGERASIAFAIWNGSQRDRDGQKSFTIWQDLQIEP